MSEHSVHRSDPPPATETDVPSGAAHAGHRKHGWMMIVCCIPMLLVAVALVASGVAGAGTILIALGCTALMLLMMRCMDHGGGPGPGR